MQFAILIKSDPNQSPAVRSALMFTRAALEAGHSIQRVFFYQGAVTTASDMLSPPQNEERVGELWSELAAKYELELVVCIAAAQRRGVWSEAEAGRLGYKAHNLRADYSISGLGQLIEASIESDRLVSFG